MDFVSSINDALNDEKWIEEMYDELNQFSTNNVWF